MIFILTLLLGVWLFVHVYLNYSAGIQQLNSWYDTSLTASEFQRLFGFFGVIHAVEFVALSALMAFAIQRLKHQIRRRSQLSTSKFLTSSLINGSIALPILSGCFIYLIAVSFSWTALFLRGSFLTAQDAGLLHYLDDTRNMHAMFSEGELYLLVRCLVYPTIAFLALSLFALVAHRSILKEARAILPALCILTGIVGWWAIPSDDQPRQRFDAARYMKAVSTPTLAFLSEYVFRKELGEEIPIIDKATLEASYPLTTYKKMIPSGYKPQQNILLLVVEALQNDVLANPELAPMFPEMSRLASDGVYFSRAFSQANDTEYSMRTILTGLHPLKFPQRDLNLDTDYPFFRIYDLLSVGGYRTGLFAAEWLVSKRITRSNLIDLHFDPQFSLPPSQEQVQTAVGRDTDEIETLSVLDERVVDALLEWVKKARESFFGVVYFYSPHFPYTVPEQFSLEAEDKESASETSFFGNTTQEIARARKNRYLRCLKFVDQLIARIREDLRAEGLEDSTTIIITGDHGQAFGENGIFGHSGPLSEITLRVPIVIWNPPESLLPLPETTTTGHLDLAPTILHLAGLPRTDAYQGISLFQENSETGEAVSPHRPVYSTVQMLSMQDAVIVWPHKLTVDNKLNNLTLYNLETDPQEQQNLGAKQPETVQLLQEELQRFRARQLGYYALPRQQRAKYFPPQIPLSIEPKDSLNLEP